MPTFKKVQGFYTVDFKTGYYKPDSTYQKIQKDEIIINKYHMGFPIKACLQRHLSEKMHETQAQLIT